MCVCVERSAECVRDLTSLEKHGNIIATPNAARWMHVSNSVARYDKPHARQSRRAHGGGVNHLLFGYFK